MTPQPLIAVKDVEFSSRWYQAVLDLTSGHGGTEYEQLLFNGQMVMQLHRWNVDHHPYLGDSRSRPYGNGVVLWFKTDDIDRAFGRVQAQEVEILDTLRLNPNANHREFWLRDPDGYVIVVAGQTDDV